MKPVLIQTLFKKMRDRIRIPEPPSSDEYIEPKRRDRTSQILLTIVILAVILVILL